MLTLGQFIVDQCPRYMAMGVSCDEYWNGDYTKLPFYRKAYVLKKRDQNYDAWLQGIYILRAIGSVIPHSEEAYPPEPLPLTKEDMDRVAERNKQTQIDNARAYMESMMHNINKQRREKGGEKDG